MNFSITSTLNKQDYIKVMFIGLYKKPSFIISAILGLYFLVTVALTYLKVIIFYDEAPVVEIISSLFLLLLPTLIVVLSVKQLNANPSFLKEMTYTFSDDGIIVQGITFKSEVNWSHIIKHKEIGKFLILYHSNKFGNFIDKSGLTTEQLQFIKSKIKKK